MRMWVLGLGLFLLPWPVGAAQTGAIAPQSTVPAQQPQAGGASTQPALLQQAAEAQKAGRSDEAIRLFRLAAERYQSVLAYEKAVPVARPWGVFVTLASGFDSNIDHDELRLDAYGVAVGTGLRFQTSVGRPFLQVEYEVGRHTYPDAPRWDRVSHNVRAELQRRMAKRLTISTVGEGSLKGSTEDRELSDQFVVQPRIELRLHRDNRLRLYAAHRIKRYPDATERDATNRYVGVELRGRAETGERWTVGYRTEVNEAAGLRYQYDRDTFYVEHISPMPRGARLELEVKYRSQWYRHRLVEVDDIDVPRHDHRWIPRISWLQPVVSSFDIELGYTFETRFSNDLDKNFQAHYTSLVLRTHW